MSSLIDEYALPNDKFGYRIYGVMAHLPEPQASQARQFHKLIGADDLATIPHCSIDNFWGPDDLDPIKAALAEIAAKHKPFETSIDFDAGVRTWPSGCAYTIASTDDHLSMQADVQAAMLQLTQRIRPPGNYWPHTTMVLDAKPEELPLMEPNLAKVDMTGTMKFETISLIGRIGLARGGGYEIIEDYPLLG
jgi:2'-5' RNA ligase